MDPINVLVLADPATPQLAMLQTLPQTTIAVGDTPEAFVQTAPVADVILRWSADLAVFEQVWRMAPRVRWVHSCSAGLDGVLFAELAASPPPTNAIPVSIRVDAAQPKSDLHPIWRFFGADEPNYATMKNGRKLIGELGSLRPKDVYFRAHNLLTSGDGKPALKWGSTGAYDEDADGHPSYNWTILDGIFDTYLQNGVRPYVEIGFMPKALSTKPEPYQHHWTPQARYDEIFTGWAYPPRDYQKWGEIVFEWTRHCIEKYGRAEVESWYWEVWNEPNIGYWRGSSQEFLKLHDYAIAGVRRALPTARVGGADTAGSGGIQLEGYSHIKVYADNGYLSGNISHKPGYIGMPYGRPQLPACEINTVVAWVNQGSQNN